MSGLKEGNRVAGAIGLRRSPATNHCEVEGGRGTGVLRRLFRVGGWWKLPKGGTTTTATSSTADGGVGRWWISPDGASDYELKLGLDQVVD